MLTLVSKMIEYTRTHLPLYMALHFIMKKMRLKLFVNLNLNKIRNKFILNLIYLKKIMISQFHIPNNLLKIEKGMKTNLIIRQNSIQGLTVITVTFIQPQAKNLNDLLNRQDYHIFKI
jgi:hypothetical protein